MNRRLLPFAAIVTLLLAGCGKQGPLERPGPLFGGPSRGIDQAQDLPAPVTTVDRRDREGADLPTDPDVTAAPQR